MVASGIGLTVLPAASVPTAPTRDGMLRYVPFAAPVPSRRVVLAWRKSFTRQAALEALRQGILACTLPGATMLPDADITES